MLYGPSDYMFEHLWLSVLTAVIGLATTLFTGYMAFKMAQLKQNGELALLSGRTVALKLEESNAAAMRELGKIKSTTEKTLKHVNDQFLIQLRLYKESMAVIAETRKAPGDQEKAEAAERMYKEHAAMQKEAAEQDVKAEHVVGAQLVEAIGSVSDSIKAATDAAKGSPAAQSEKEELTSDQMKRISKIMDERNKGMHGA